MRERITWVVAGFLTATSLAGGSQEPDSRTKRTQATIRPSLTVRLVRPDRQLERLIALFDGSRARHPAAALSAWKRATHNPVGLGKAREAAIALLNPEMVRELRALDDAEAAVGFDDDGRTRWFATIPRDDGTFAALATALALTDGGSDPPIGDLTVDRLGPAGSPLMGRDAGVCLVAGTRMDLKAALEHARAGPPGHPGTENGFLFHLDPSGPSSSAPSTWRGLVAALDAIGCRGIDGMAGLDGETFSLVINGRYVDAPPGRPGALEPGWLDWVPADRAVAAIALAIDPTTWDVALTAADRVERADPGRSKVAPLRTRLNLGALAVGVRPEAELRPFLRGISGCILADRVGEVAGALIAVHVTDEANADRIARRVVPRLGRLAGRPFKTAHRGSTVLIGWGDSTLAACLDAQAHPDRSAGPTIRASWGTKLPQRAGAFWPGRLRALTAPGSPLAPALAEGPPVLWSGIREGTLARDEIRWTGLRGLVRRFLDRLPMEPPSGVRDGK